MDPRGRRLVGSLGLRGGCRILVLLRRGGGLLRRDIRRSIFFYRMLGSGMISSLCIWGKERKGRDGFVYRPRTGSGFFGGGGT